MTNWLGHIAFAKQPQTDSLGLELDKNRIRCYQGITLNGDGRENADARESRDDEDAEIASY